MQGITLALNLNMSASCDLCRAAATTLCRNIPFLHLERSYASWETGTLDVCEACSVVIDICVQRLQQPLCEACQMVGDDEYLCDGCNWADAPIMSTGERPDLIMAVLTMVRDLNICVQCYICAPPLIVASQTSTAA